MEDLAEKLTDILGNPEIIENLSGLFGSSENKQNRSDTNENSDSENTSGFDFSPDVIQKIIKILPLISSINQEDKYTKFLYALKPLLSKKRQEKLGNSAKIIKLIKIIPLLKDQDLF